MPFLTRLWLKAALAYLVAALATGVVLLAPGLRDRWPWVGLLGPVYFHLFMVGWVTQTIFGVAYWMFPKAAPDRPRGSEFLAILTVILLNGGLLLRAVAEPLNALHPRTVWGGLLAASAVLQWLEIGRAHV